LSREIKVEWLDYSAGWEKIEPEWDALLKDSVRPTIFASYDYITTSLSHLNQGEKAFLLLFRDTCSGQVLALFPLSIVIRKIHGVHLREVMHALPPQSTEVDKPCPIIQREMEEACWVRFAEYFRTEYLDWDVLNLEELISDSGFPALAKRIFPSPRFRSRVNSGPDSPIVRLDGEWSTFWDQHRKLRKKCGRLERRIEGLTYRITSDPADVEQSLAEYVDTEIKSWKEGDMVARHKEFYAALLPKLADKNQLWFGLMYDDAKVVSLEIAYTYLDQVYFCHGTYLPEYAAHSPGMVNSCWFVKHFHGKGFREGDYLAGFADYISPWASRFEHTSHVVIRRMTCKNIYLALWHKLGNLKRRMKKKEKEQSDEI
jgi:CelD/BcsL family acetyltransferase involved in cellulose biosynthesis